MKKRNNNTSGTTKIVILSIILVFIMSIYITYKLDSKGKVLEFTLKKGQNFKVNIGEKDFSKLTFRNCKLTIIATDGTKAEQNIARVLNKMVRSLKGLDNPDYFKLTRSGLNVYSFRVKGVSDAETIEANGNKILPKWLKTDKITLHGYYYVRKYIN